ESGSDEVTELQLFLETIHTLRSRTFTVNPGIALYQVTGRTVAVEPRLRLTARPRLSYGTHRFSIAAGVYHQGVVGLNDERDVGNVFTVWTPAADTLDLPSAVHVVAGWAGRFSGGLGASVEAFVKDFRELSVPQFSPFPSFTTALQPADGTAIGADLRVELHDRPFLAGSTFDGYVSYSYADVEYQTATFDYNPAQHRRHQVNVVAHTEKDGLGITVQWQYGTGFPFTASAGFDEFQILTPTTDVSTQPGVTRVLYDRPFGRRQPPYERIDVWLDRESTIGRARLTLRAGIINLFNRDNLFYFDLFTLRRVDQMPLIPSVGVKVELL
ncbi:MAG: hypothetical protein R3282_01060, partial [Rhodothermales bacterium]|nr:hypothetical protein [Rhodothermales bacterium]